MGADRVAGGARGGQVGRRARAEQFSLLGLGAVGLIAVADRSGRPLVALLGLVALLVVPGGLLVRLFPVVDPFARWALVLASSAGVETAAATVLVLTGWWHPVVLAETLLAGCVLALVLSLWTGGRPGARGADPG